MKLIRKNLIYLLFTAAITVSGQSLSLEQAISMALKNNPGVQSAQYQVEQFAHLKIAATDLGKTSVVLMRGQYNSVNTDNNISILQTLPFPTTLMSNYRLGKEQQVGAEQNLELVKNDLVYAVKLNYDHLLYLQSARLLLLSQDSLFRDFVKASTLRFETGESNLLEKTTAEAQWNEVKNELQLNGADIKIAETNLSMLIKSEAPVTTQGKLEKKEMISASNSFEQNPQLKYFQQQVIIGQRFRGLEQHRLLPDILIGYFNQSLIGIQNINGQDTYFDKSKRFSGFQLGVAFPLWIAPQIARAKSAQANVEMLRKNTEHLRLTLNSEFQQTMLEVEKNQASLTYYETVALKNANLILNQSRKAFANGEIGYLEFLQALRQAISIKGNYLNALQRYNQSVIKFNYLQGNP